MERFIKTELIDNYIKENGLSKTVFCKLCKISLATLNNIYANKNFRIPTLLKIISALKIKADDFYCN